MLTKTRDFVTNKFNTKKKKEKKEKKKKEYVQSIIDSAIVKDGSDSPSRILISFNIPLFFIYSHPSSTVKVFATIVVKENISSSNTNLQSQKQKQKKTHHNLFYLCACECMQCKRLILLKKKLIFDKSTNNVYACMHDACIFSFFTLLQQVLRGKDHVYSSIEPIQNHQQSMIN